jgi:DNA-binding NtrC family response regulator
MAEKLKKILIIDDERSIRATLKEILEFEKYIVETAQDGIEGYKMAGKKNYDLIFCDIKMPKIDGIETLKNIVKNNISSPVVMISGHGDIETAVQTLKIGAFDYIEKPLDLNRVLKCVKNALNNNHLKKENTILKNKIKSKSEIIGQSQEIKSILELIVKVANSNARVLITGPNGTGKELVANQIHEKSGRNRNLFVEINCAAIPSELIESELFGHEKGAFTSAFKEKIGKFEEASNGTLFLDEIGDMSLSAQSKVLRALQENKITRVGSNKSISVNPRIIAATNKNLKKEIENGNFREDLFHRLNVIPIEVPSLKERNEDIPILCRYFIEKICKEQGVKQKKISAKAINELKKMKWTGNIRELRNVVERLIILTDKDIDLEDIKKYVPAVT